MPTYAFECDIERDGCGHCFESQYTMSEIVNASPKCPQCNKQQSVHRNYQMESVMFYDTTPRTVGTLAERNAKKSVKKLPQKKKYTGPQPLKKDDPRRNDH